MLKSSILCGVALALLSAGLSADAQPTAYHIRVKPTVTGAFTLVADIVTNIPGTFRATACVVLRGSSKSDDLVGTGAVPVSIVNGKGHLTFDLRTADGADLPAGNYDLEIEFEPSFPENTALATQAGIRRAVVGRAKVKLQASGGSAKAFKRKQDGQSWVMENISGHSEWDPSMWIRRFGGYERVPCRNDPHSGDMRMFYVPSIDMSLLVNIESRAIITWRRGLDNEC